MTTSINSLTSILSSYGYGTTTKTDASSAIDVAIAKLLEQADTKASTSTTGTQVSISPAATAAAAAQADNAKDYSVLSKEVRAALDSQYAKGVAKGSADLSGLSGRGLSIVALNKDGQFTAAESRAAKVALRQETQQSFASTIGKGTDLSALANFSKQLAAQYDSMSPEEREARGWSEQFRDSNADFAAKSAMPTLFDQM